MGSKAAGFLGSRRAGPYEHNAFPVAYIFRNQSAYRADAQGNSHTSVFVYVLCHIQTSDKCGE